MAEGGGNLGGERRRRAALRRGGERRGRDFHPRPPVRVGAIDLPTVGVDDHDDERRPQLVFDGAAADLEGEARGGRSEAAQRCGGGRRRWRGNGRGGKGGAGGAGGAAPTRRGHGRRLGAAGRVIVINDMERIVTVGACVWPLAGAQGISIFGGDTLFEDSVPFGYFRSF